MTPETQSTPAKSILFALAVFAAGVCHATGEPQMKRQFRIIDRAAIRAVIGGGLNPPGSK